MIPSMRFARWSLITFAVALPASCGGHRLTQPSAPDTAAIAFIIEGLRSTRLVSIEVSGPGIDSLLVFNLAIDTTGTGSGTERIPVGSGRHIVVNAYDQSGVNTHRGDTTVTLVEGLNPALSLVLRPLVGSLPITITFGGSGITLTPGDTTIAVGDTVRYTGGGIDSLGNGIASSAIVWSSSLPSIASVAGSGLVEGRAVGIAWVIATFGGASTGRQITVH